jgi:dolichol-phosphate mannosyltransferase
VLRHSNTINCQRRKRIRKLKSYIKDQVEPDVSVILPSYNERENIIRLIEGLENVLDAWYLQIVVVDDNSPDGTHEVVAARAEIDDCVTLLNRTDKRGLASALSDGVRLSSGRMIIFMDSDMQMEPDNLPKLITVLEQGYDVVVGSRWMEGGADLRCEGEQGATSLSRINRVLSRWLSIFAAAAFRVKHTDFTGGLIAMRRHVLEGHVIRGDHGDYLIYLLHYILKNDFKVKEIPYVLVPRTEGESKTTDNYVDFFFKGCQYLGAIMYLAIFTRYK